MIADALELGRLSADKMFSRGIFGNIAKSHIQGDLHIRTSGGNGKGLSC
jgi:hypothetical protein